MIRRLAGILQHPAAKTMIATMIVGVGMKMLTEVRDAFHEEITGARTTLQHLHQAHLAMQTFITTEQPHPVWPGGAPVEFIDG